MDFRWDIVQEYAPMFLRGAGYTIGFSLLAVVFGSILGLLIAFGTMQKNKILSFPFKLYVSFFRGTPLLVQIMLIHFGVMPFLMSPPVPWVSAVVSLSLNAGAYISEIFRAGIQSIDRGQMEAARSLGMSQFQAMRLVILPQAIKRMIPPLGNEFVTLIKDSSLAALISAQELMYWGRAVQGQYARPWEGLLTVAFGYYVITLVFTGVLSLVERKLKTND